MKKKVAIITLHLNFGGIELASTNLANMLSERFDVTIINMYKSSMPYKLDEKVKLISLSELEPNKEEFITALKNKNLINVLLEGIRSVKILFLREHLVKKHLANNEYDIIISSRYLFTKLINKMKLNSKKIAIEHKHHNGNKKYIKNLVRATNNIDFLVTVSKELKEYYEPLVKCDCIYIPNCIEYYPEKICSNKKKQIISVGRLSPEKGFDDLIDIYSELEKNNPDWNLVIAGDGNERSKLENKIKEKKLTNKIEITGFIKKDKLNSIYDESSIFLMTSHEESFGIVVVEAQSFGIPCITFSTATGVLELVNEKNGFVVSGRNKNEMVEKIKMLINNDDLYRKKSNKSRIDAKKFEFNKIKMEWIEFLEKKVEVKK